MSELPRAVPDRALQIVSAALSEEGQARPTSYLVDQAMRVARLRGDVDAILWLRLESTSVGEDAISRKRFIAEMAKIVPYDVLRSKQSDAVEEYIAERTFKPVDGDEGLIPVSVAELEQRIASADQTLTLLGQRANAHPDETRELHDAVMPSLLQFREILARVRHRVNGYLTRAEVELLLDITVSGVFEDVRMLVDRTLQRIDPEAMAMLAAAYRRRAEGDQEARSHALASCRRALKSLADALYPPRAKPAVGADGSEHALTDDKWINRLVQFVNERGRSNASELTVALLEHVDVRLKALNDLTSEAVHSTVTDAEVNQCVVQTYLVMGDIVRIADAG